MGEANNRGRASSEFLTSIMTTTLQGSDRSRAGWQKLTGHRELCSNDVCEGSLMSFDRKDH